MKRLILRLIVCGMLTGIACLLNAQVKYINLSISQTKIEECVTGIENTFTNIDLKLFPNPSKGIFKLEFDSKSSYNQVVITIYDISGNAVLNQRLSFGGQFREYIDLSGYQPGSYLLYIKDENHAVFRANLIMH